MDINILTEDVVARGEGRCEGGARPDPPIDRYPLLAWAGGAVRTEDGRASVSEIAVAFAETPSLDALAARFGTTPHHAAQAMDYAIEAGFPGR